MIVFKVRITAHAVSNRIQAVRIHARLLTQAAQRGLKILNAAVFERISSYTDKKADLAHRAVAAGEQVHRQRGVSLAREPAGDTRIFSFSPKTSWIISTPGTTWGGIIGVERFAAR